MENATLNTVYLFTRLYCQYDSEKDFFGGDCTGLYCTGVNAISIYTSSESLTIRIMTPLNIETFHKLENDNFTLKKTRHESDTQYIDKVADNLARCCRRNR